MTDTTILPTFIVNVIADIEVTGPDGASFITKRAITWEVIAENAGEAAYSYWTGKVIGWSKIS